MNKLFLLCALLVSSPCHADDFQEQSYVKYGVGVFSSALDSSVEVKTISAGHHWALGDLFITQVELGGWTDSRCDLKRSGSFFTDAAFGVSVNAGYFYAQTLFGGAFLSATDSYLGSHLQFNEDMGIGIKDARGVGVGVSYKHMSSAGIFKPNTGRDFGTIQVTIPW
jgi:hypothetical protein